MQIFFHWVFISCSRYRQPLFHTVLLLYFKILSYYAHFKKTMRMTSLEKCYRNGECGSFNFLLILLGYKAHASKRSPPWKDMKTRG